MDDHQTGVDKGLLEKLTLEHPNQVFDADVLARRSLDNTSIGLYLLSEPTPAKDWSDSAQPERLGAFGGVLRTL